MEAITLTMAATAIAKYGPSLVNAAAVLYDSADDYMSQWTADEEQRRLKAAVTVTNSVLSFPGLIDFLPAEFVSAAGVPSSLKQKGALDWVKGKFSSDTSEGPSSLYNPRWVPNERDYNGLSIRTYDAAIPNDMKFLYATHMQLFYMIFDEDGKPNTSVTAESRRSAFVYLKMVDELIRRLNTGQINRFAANLVLDGISKSINQAIIYSGEEEQYGKIFGAGSEDLLRTGKDASKVRAVKNFVGSLVGSESKMSESEGVDIIENIDNAKSQLEKSFLDSSLETLTKDLAGSMEDNTLQIFLHVCRKFGATIPKNPTNETVSEIEFENPKSNISNIFKLFVKHYENEFNGVDERTLELELKSLIGKSNDNYGENFVKDLMVIFDLVKSTSDLKNLQKLSGFMGSLTNDDLTPLYKSFFSSLSSTLEKSRDRIESMLTANKFKVKPTTDQYKHINSIIRKLTEIKKTSQYILEKSIPELGGTDKQQKITQVNQTVHKIKASINHSKMPENERLALYGVLQQQQEEAVKRITAGSSPRIVTADEINLQKSNIDLLTSLNKNIQENIKNLLPLMFKGKDLVFLQNFAECSVKYSATYLDYLIEQYNGKSNFDSLVVVFKLMSEINFATFGHDGMGIIEAEELRSKLENAFGDFKKNLESTVIPRRSSKEEDITLSTKFDNCFEKIGSELNSCSRALSANHEMFEKIRSPSGIVSAEDKEDSLSEQKDYISSPRSPSKEVARSSEEKGDEVEEFIKNIARAGLCVFARNDYFKDRQTNFEDMLKGNEVRELQNDSALYFFYMSSIDLIKFDATRADLLTGKAMFSKKLEDDVFLGLAYRDPKLKGDSLQYRQGVFTAQKIFFEKIRTNLLGYKKAKNDLQKYGEEEKKLMADLDKLDKNSSGYLESLTFISNKLKLVKGNIYKASGDLDTLKNNLEQLSDKNKFISNAAQPNITLSAKIIDDELGGKLNDSDRYVTSKYNKVFKDGLNTNVRSRVLTSITDDVSSANDKVKEIDLSLTNLDREIKRQEQLEKQKAFDDEIYAAIDSAQKKVDGFFSRVVTIDECNVIKEELNHKIDEICNRFGVAVSAEEKIESKFDLSGIVFSQRSDIQKINKAIDDRIKKIQLTENEIEIKLDSLPPKRIKQGFFPEISSTSYSMPFDVSTSILACLENAKDQLCDGSKKKSGKIFGLITKPRSSKAKKNIDHRIEGIEETINQVNAVIPFLVVDEIAKNGSVTILLSLKQTLIDSAFKQASFSSRKLDVAAWNKNNLSDEVSAKKIADAFPSETSKLLAPAIALLNVEIQLARYPGQHRKLELEGIRRNLLGELLAEQKQEQSISRSNSNN